MLCYVISEILSCTLSALVYRLNIGVKSLAEFRDVFCTERWLSSVTISVHNFFRPLGLLSPQFTDLALEGFRRVLGPLQEVVGEREGYFFEVSEVNLFL